MSGLEKFSFLKTYVQRITFEHGHSGRFNETFDVANNVENVTREDRDSQYRPLIGRYVSHEKWDLYECSL